MILTGSGVTQCRGIIKGNEGCATSNRAFALTAHYISVSILHLEVYSYTIHIYICFIDVRCSALTFVTWVFEISHYILENLHFKPQLSDGPSRICIRFDLPVR